MRIINPRIHGVLDYLTVVFLLLAPTIFDLGETGATFSYILGVVHLALTLLTAFPLGAYPLIPFRLHGIVEFVVGVLLVVVTFIISFEADNNSLQLFRYLGLVILVIFFLTNYRAKLE